MALEVKIKSSEMFEQLSPHEQVIAVKTVQQTLGMTYEGAKRVFLQNRKGILHLGILCQVFQCPLEDMFHIEGVEQVQTIHSGLKQQYHGIPKNSKVD